MLRYFAAISAADRGEASSVYDDDDDDECWDPLLLCDHVSLSLQGLLQALGLQQQLVHGHLVLLPLLLLVPLRHLQGLELTAQPAQQIRAEEECGEEI